MFTLSKNYAVDRTILKCDFITFTPPSLNLVNGEINRTFNDIPREEKAFSLKDTYHKLDFNVTQTAGAHAW